MDQVMVKCSRLSEIRAKIESWPMTIENETRFTFQSD